MKKRVTATVFLLLLTGSVIWMIIEGTKPEILPVGSNLPDIGFLTQDGKTTIEKTNKKILIVFFSKECPHCKYELNVLNDNVEKLKDTKIYLFTIDKDFFRDEKIRSYSNLTTNKNVTFGIVNKEEYKAKLGGMVTPTLYFFNEKGILTAKLKGETKLERILQELNKQKFP